MRVFLTGVAGFIGFHLARTLLERGDEVFGYDNINDYYDPAVKYSRLETLEKQRRFQFTRADLCDAEALRSAYMKCKPDVVVHLAAQAGVRYSISNPHAYIQSNIVGFQNIIELVRETRPANFVYASSSSVYGGNKTFPFSEDQNISNPVSLYAASKASNELVARCYGNLYELPSSGLRFFTVYGPFSRPDMAMFKFAELMREGKPIDVYNHGKMVRDFTYIDDIVSGIIGAMNRPAVGEVYNLGAGAPMELMEMIELLETNLNIKAIRNMMPMQLGDVPMTISDISKAKRLIGYEPKTKLAEGVKQFAQWYRSFRKL